MKRRVVLLFSMVTMMALLLCACGTASGFGKKSGSSSSKESTVSMAKSDKTDNNTGTDTNNFDKTGNPDTDPNTLNYRDGDTDTGNNAGDAGAEPSDNSGSNPAGDNSDGGEYALEYMLSYGYQNDSEGRQVFHLNGEVTVNDEVRITDMDWYNKTRSMAVAMFFPDLFGEAVCQLYLDFALWDGDNEVFINLPYDNPNGVFDNADALQYNDDAIDNGGALRIDFPISISGLGTDTLDIMDTLTDFHYVFSLVRDTRN